MKIGNVHVWLFFSLITQIDMYYPDAPLVESLPHFYLGNESLLDTINGLNPKKDLHQTFLDIEPVSDIHSIWFANPNHSFIKTYVIYSLMISWFSSGLYSHSQSVFITKSRQK